MHYLRAGRLWDMKKTKVFMGSRVRSWGPELGESNLGLHSS